MLVTGGAGYLGRHVCLALVNAGHTVEILDSFSRGSPRDILDLEEELGATVPSHPIDIWLEASSLKRLFHSRKFGAVIHLAGVKPGSPQRLGVAQCCAIDVGGTMNLLSSMEDAECRNLVFCSTVSIYGDREDGTKAWRESDWPLDSQTPPSAYGVAKDAIERILCCLGKDWSIRVLRCPEIAGALPGGGLGDTDQSSTVGRLLASSSRTPAHVRSGHPDTADGSVVRDYVHVVDAARAHVLALEGLESGGIEQFNVGSGRGTSMWQLLLGLQRAKRVTIPSLSTPIDAHAPGAGIRLSDARKLQNATGWAPLQGMQEICLHSVQAVNKSLADSKDVRAGGTSMEPNSPLDSRDRSSCREQGAV